MVDHNGRRFDTQAWLRGAAIVAGVLVPTYYSFIEQQRSNERRITLLENIVMTLQERQGARVPLFDRMVNIVDDHDRRLQRIEGRLFGGHYQGGVP